MRFPWSKPEVDVAAIAREAATTAVREYTEVNAPKIASEAAEQAASGVKEELTRAMTSALSPLLAPVPVTSGSPMGVYAIDNPIWYSTPQAPNRRPGSNITVQTLRNLADNYDVLRACIQHLKSEVMVVPIQIVPKDPKRKNLGTKIARAEAFFASKGGLGGFNRKRGHFEGAILEDLLVIGAASIFYHPYRDGTLCQAIEIDAATIRPRTDAYGFPGPGEAVYEQWIQGVLVAGYGYDHMDYLGLAQNTRSYSPYPASPVEWLVHSINAALRVDQWNLSYLTDGTTATEKFSLPEDWTVDQIKAFSVYWDALLSGNTDERQKTKFLPSGSKQLSTANRKDYDFEELSLWLLRRTCAVMQVQPASIGYAGEQYKVSQNDSMESTSEFGAGSLLAWRRDAYNDILERLDCAELEVQDIKASEEKASERAERNKDLVGTPIKRINEARKEEGLDPDPNGDEILIPNTMVPLSVILKIQSLMAEPAVAHPGAVNDSTDANTELADDTNDDGTVLEDE